MVRADKRAKKWRTGAAAWPKVVFPHFTSLYFTSASLMLIHARITTLNCTFIDTVACKSNGYVCDMLARSWFQVQKRTLFC